MITMKCMGYKNKHICGECERLARSAEDEDEALVKVFETSGNSCPMFRKLNEIR
jgi:hypothetical protein